MNLSYAQSTFIEGIIAVVVALLIGGAVVAMFVWLRSSQKYYRRNQQWYDDYVKSVKDLETTKVAVVSRLETLVIRLKTLMDRYEKTGPEQSTTAENPKNE